MANLPQTFLLEGASEQERLNMLSQIQSAGRELGAKLALLSLIESLQQPQPLEMPLKVSFRDISDPALCRLLKAQGLVPPDCDVSDGPGGGGWAVEGKQALKAIAAIETVAHHGREGSLQIALYDHPERKGAMWQEFSLNLSGIEQSGSLFEAYAKAADSFVDYSFLYSPIRDSAGRQVANPLQLSFVASMGQETRLAAVRIAEYVKSDPQLKAELDAFKQECSAQLQRGAVSKSAPSAPSKAESAQQISDERLTLISEPVLRTGTVRSGARAGQPYYLVEINACKTRAYGSKEPPAYYKLAVFGEQKSAERLTSMLHKQMKVCVSGSQTEKTYLNAKGEAITARRITADGLSLEPVQPGLNKLTFDKSAVPEHFAQACALYQGCDVFTPHHGGQYERADGLQLQVMRFKAGQQEVIPEKGPYAGSSCREVELTACGFNGTEPGFYRLRTVMPAANALAMENRLEAGLALRVSGSMRQSGQIMAGERAHPIFEGSINHIGIDLKQHALQGIDFEVKQRSQGVPAPTTAPKAQGMER